MSTHFFIAATAALRISSSGEIGLVSKVNVVVQTQSIPTLANSAFTCSVGNVYGFAIAKSTTSNPISFAFSMIQRSFSLKSSAQIKLSTPNLNFITTPSYFPQNSF